MPELWDIYDENHRRTGRIIERKKRHELKDGEYHQVVCILIINSHHEVLIQRRALHKEGWPGAWADTGGAALAGESSQEAIIREVYEEIGILLEPSEVTLLVSQKVQKDVGYFRDVYIAHKDFDLSKCVLDKEEVMDVQWASMDLIESYLKTENFLHFNDSYMPMFRAYMANL